MPPDLAITPEQMSELMRTRALQRWDKYKTPEERRAQTAAMNEARARKRELMTDEDKAALSKEMSRRAKVRELNKHQRLLKEYEERRKKDT
jgi:hypothetical protein